MTAFTNEQKARAAIRECGFRKRVYPGLVERQKMSQQQADEQIAIMQAIADEYQTLAEKERLL